jgi:hypothetical protein
MVLCSALAIVLGNHSPAGPRATQRSPTLA